MTIKDENNDFRRRIIARVEALRKEACLPMLRFREQIGPATWRDWKRFVEATPDEAWHHFSLKGITCIGNVFGVGVELLQFNFRQRP